MVIPGSPGNGDGAETAAEILAQKSGGEPAGDDEHRPLHRPFIPVQPQPDPGKIGEAIAHAQPQQEPEGIRALYGAGVEQQVKAAVIHQKIKQAAAQTKKKGQVFFAAEQGDK